MKITSPDGQRYWQHISAHATASNGQRGHASAPWPVQVHVAALLNNREIEASIANFHAEAPTTWDLSLITTDSSLVRIGMQFDAEEYEVAKDREAAEPLIPTVLESWIRRLSDVDRLGIGRSRLRPASLGRSQMDVLDVADVTLTFRDGTVVDLGVDQLRMTMYDDRSQSDAFVDRLRALTQL